MIGNKNPKLRKNGGKGTFFGNLLRGALSIGKTFSPGLVSIIENATGIQDIPVIEGLLKKEQLTELEYQYLTEQLSADKTELQEITKRWEADMKSQSWLSKNVRPATLVLYNVSCLAFIALDSCLDSFIVRELWINILLSNTGIVNSAYFGSRYLEKRDNKRYAI